MTTEDGSDSDRADSELSYTVLGDPADEPTLRLDHERFAYAGKFVMGTTGKAVARSGDEILAAVAFNRDRTDDAVAWIRYVTVRADRRGEGIGSTLIAYAAEHLLETADRVRIAVNNPFAYEAAYKAGFGYTGEETGLAELLLERPAARSTVAYWAGFDVFAGRSDLTEAEQQFLSSRRDGDSPPVE